METLPRIEGALGAALFVWHQLLENPREPARPDHQRGSLLGPEYSAAEIETATQIGDRKMRAIARFTW